MLSNDECVWVRVVLVGYLVLMIVEYDLLCIVGGMFCFNVYGDCVLFDINFDVVVCSGVCVYLNVFNFV